MANISEVDQLVNSLSFEVEAVPQKNVTKLTSTSNSTPLNVRIKVRKKEQCGMEQGYISVPKFGRPGASPERVRLISSDQTIVSFDVSMEADFEKKPKKKPRKLFFGGCLGTEYDDDEVPYTASSTYKAKTIDTSTPSKSDGVIRQKFTLSKTKYDNPKALQQYTKKQSILGKCKPGGCLDPPFSEEKYSYEPTSFKDNAIEDSVKTKPKIKLTKAVEYQETKEESKLPSEDSITQKNEDNSGSILSIYENSLKGSLDSKYSDTVITYPPLMYPSAISNEKSSKFRVSNEEKPRKSYNDCIGAYFTSPRRSNRFKDRDSSSTDINKKEKTQTFIPMPVPIPVPTSNSDKPDISKLPDGYSVSPKKTVNDEFNREKGKTVTGTPQLDNTLVSMPFEDNNTVLKSDKPDITKSLIGDSVSPKETFINETNREKDETVKSSLLLDDTLVSKSLKDDKNLSKSDKSVNAKIPHRDYVSQKEAVTDESSEEKDETVTSTPLLDDMLVSIPLKDENIVTSSDKYGITKLRVRDSISQKEVRNDKTNIEKDKTDSSTPPLDDTLVSIHLTDDNIVSETNIPRNTKSPGRNSVSPKETVTDETKKEIDKTITSTPLLDETLVSIPLKDENIVSETDKHGGDSISQKEARSNETNKEKDKTVTSTPPLDDTLVSIPLTDDNSISETDTSRNTKSSVRNSVSPKEAVTDETKKERDKTITSTPLLDETLVSKSLNNNNVVSESDKLDIRRLSVGNSASAKKIFTNNYNNWEKDKTDTRTPLPDETPVSTIEPHVTPLKVQDLLIPKEVHTYSTEKNKSKKNMMTHSFVNESASLDYNEPRIAAPYDQVFSEKQKDIDIKYIDDNKNDKTKTFDSTSSYVPPVINDLILQKSDESHVLAANIKGPVSIKDTDTYKEKEDLRSFVPVPLLMPIKNNKTGSKSDKTPYVPDVSSPIKNVIESDYVALNNEDIISSNDSKLNQLHKDPLLTDTSVWPSQNRIHDENFSENLNIEATNTILQTKPLEVTEAMLQSNLDAFSTSGVIHATDKNNISYPEPYASNNVFDELNMLDDKAIIEQHKKASSQINTLTDEEYLTRNSKTYVHISRDDDNSELTLLNNQTQGTSTQNILRSSVEGNFIPRKKSSSYERPIFIDATDFEDSIPEECDQIKMLSSNEEIKKNYLNLLNKLKFPVEITEDNIRTENEKRFSDIKKDVSGGFTNFFPKLTDDNDGNESHYEKDNIQLDSNGRYVIKEFMQRDKEDIFQDYDNNDAIKGTQYDNMSHTERTKYNSFMKPANKGYNKINADGDDENSELTLLNNQTQTTSNQNILKSSIILEDTQLAPSQEAPLEIDSKYVERSIISNTSSGILKQGSFDKGPTRRALHISIPEEKPPSSRFVDPLTRKNKYMQKDKPAATNTEWTTTQSARKSKDSVLPKIPRQELNINISERRNIDEKENDISAVSSKLSLKRESISLNLGFQSYVNDRNERSLKTIDPSSENTKFSDDSITVIQSNLRPNGNEIRIPIDLDNDMIIQIHRTKSPTQHTQIMEQDRFDFNKSMPGVPKRYGLQEIQNANCDSHSQDCYEKYCNEIPTILNSIYEQELVPLQKTINQLKKEIEMLAGQQSILIEKLSNVKRNKPIRLIHVNSRCACFR